MNNNEYITELSNLDITEVSPDIDTLCLDKQLFESYHTEFPILEYIERHLERKDNKIDFDPFEFFNCELTRQLKLEIWTIFVLDDNHNYLQNNLQVIVRDLYNEDTTQRSLKNLSFALKEFINNPDGLISVSNQLYNECVEYIKPCFLSLIKRELTGKGLKKKKKYIIKKTKKRKNRNKKSKKIYK